MEVAEASNCAFHKGQFLEHLQLFVMCGLSGGSATKQYDLYQLFGLIAEIIIALQHRFDGLPIHRIVYYNSYHQGVRQRQILMDATKLHPTGNHQDCLGMTWLHILTCSSVHDLELYRVIIENYPTSLITEDRWGGTITVVCILGSCTS
jgi:hypothetical protein